MRHSARPCSITCVVAALDKDATRHESLASVSSRALYARRAVHLPLCTLALAVDESSSFGRTHVGQDRSAFRRSTDLRLIARHFSLWPILLKNSSSNSSRRFLRNNDSIRAGKLNHRCACYRWDDRILRARSPCGVFQQNRPTADIASFLRSRLIRHCSCSR